jgi:hypothetical protein
MAEGLMTALDLQKPPVNDLHGQGVQMVRTLKMTVVFSIAHATYFLNL